MEEFQQVDSFLDLEIPEEDLEYETDEGYQQLFLRFFRIPSDDEFNEERVCEGLAAILGKTQGNELLHNLYVKAAGQFLSEDPEIGLPVVLSYTYFSAFYKIFTYYLQEGATPEWEDKVREMTALFTTGSSA